VDEAEVMKVAMSPEREMMAIFNIPFSIFSKHRLSYEPRCQLLSWVRERLKFTLIHISQPKDGSAGLCMGRVQGI